MIICQTISALFILLGLLGFSPSHAEEDMTQHSSSVQHAAEEHLRLGVDFFLSDELEVAIDEFREAARQQPGYAEAYHNLGVALAKTGDLTGAIAAWSQAERLDFQAGSSRYHLSSLISYNYGISLVRDGRLEQAMEQWQAALRIQPGFAEAHYALGLGLLAVGNPIQAVAHFQKVIHEHPEWPNVFEALGFAHYDSHDYVLAEQAWRQALALKPDLPTIHANLGLLRLQEGNFQEAIHYSREAVALQPDLEAAHYNLGVAFLAKGDEAASIKSLETVLLLNSRSTAARLLLGAVWSRMGNWARAASLWSEALRQDPFSPDEVWLHHNLGLAMAAMGYKDEAVGEFRSVVDLRPEWAPGWSQLGLAHLANRQWEKALSALKKAAQLQPAWAHLYFSMGRACVELGKLSQAIIAFQRAVELEPRLVEAWFHLGVVFRAQNKTSEAVEPLRRAAEGGSGDAQSLLAAMYANGSGVDRNLPLAILWWFRSSRSAMTEDVRQTAGEQLSHFRRSLHRHHLSPPDRQEVLTGFNLIREHLYGHPPLQQLSAQSVKQKEIWDHLTPTDRVLTWVIEQAWALDQSAQRMLHAWLMNGEAGKGTAAGSRIRDFFLQTAKEGDPFSCQVVQSMAADSSTADLPDWPLAQKECPERPMMPAW